LTRLAAEIPGGVIDGMSRRPEERNAVGTDALAAGKGRGEIRARDCRWHRGGFLQVSVLRIRARLDASRLDPSGFPRARTWPEAVDCRPDAKGLTGLKSGFYVILGPRSPGARSRNPDFSGQRPGRMSIIREIGIPVSGGLSGGVLEGPPRAGPGRERVVRGYKKYNWRNPDG